MPDIPVVAEVLPGFEVVGWSGMVGPAHLQAPVLKKLRVEIVRALNEPGIRDRILSDGSEPVGSSPEQFRKFLLADLAKWARVVKESGAKVE